MTTIQWHRPSERMPDDENTILIGFVLNNGDRVTDGGWRHDGQWYDSTGWPIRDEAVIAWTPLPECPL